MKIKKPKVIRRSDGVIEIGASDIEQRLSVIRGKLLSGDSLQKSESDLLLGIIAARLGIFEIPQ